MNDATATQLGLIAETARVLDEIGVACWLYGGWAMDFHAGAVTRDHADIELFVLTEDAAVVREALVAAGFGAPEGLHPDEGQPFLKDAQEVSVTYLARHSEDDLRVPGRWWGWAFPSGAFDEARVRLGDVEVAAMSVEGLLAMKLGFADQAHGTAMREKDVADVALLQRIMASRLDDDW